MLIEDTEIAGVEPAAGKRLAGGLLVLEIPLHDDVAAEHDLADGFAIARHFLHGLRVEHRDRLLQRIRHALPSLQLGALLGRQVVPARLLGADRGGTIDFSQAVNVGELDADPLGAGQHGHRGRGAGDQADDGFC